MFIIVYLVSFLLVAPVARGRKLCLKIVYCILFLQVNSTTNTIHTQNTCTHIRYIKTLSANDLQTLQVVPTTTGGSWVSRAAMMPWKPTAHREVVRSKAPPSLSSIASCHIAIWKLKILQKWAPCKNLGI